MEYIWQKFKDEVADFLVDAGVKKEEIVLQLPPSDFDGALAFPCHVLSKRLKKAPNLIAEEIVAKKSKNEKGSLIGEVVNVGPYVNFSVSSDVYLRDTVAELKECGEMYGSGRSSGRKIGIEFVQPNTNKALSIGHARNASLGSTMSRIFEFAGDGVVKINLFNDRGVHICKSMLAYQKWGNNTTPDQEGLKPDHFVGKYYVMFTQKAAEDDKLEDEAKAMLRDWEEGKSEVVELWKKMNGWFYEGVEQTFVRYGIDFDKIYYESEIYKYGRDIIESALENGYCYKLDDGAIEVDLEDKKLGKKILQRQDGTSVYIVQDLFLAKKKFEDLGLDLSIYVVADEQKYHFDVLFELLDRFEIVDREKNYHLPYGMVNLKDGKMSSRRGTVVKMDDLLNELHELAKKQILSREDDIQEDELNRRAEIIGQAAMKFNLLNQDKNKVLIFNKEEAVRFEGETGPYLLYTYARIKSILLNAGDDYLDDDFTQLGTANSEAVDIVVDLSRLSDVIKKVAEEYNPAILTKYLYGIAQKYNNYYHHHRILDAKSRDDRMVGLVLSWSVAQVIKIGTRLLGIDVVEKM